jgi:hypothetical protein
MKQKVFLSVAFFLIGICIGGVAECAKMSSKAEKDKQAMQAIIDNSRNTIIEFNKEYNKLYNDLGYLAIGENNDFAKVGAFMLLCTISELKSCSSHSSSYDYYDAPRK